MLTVTCQPSHVDRYLLTVTCESKLKALELDMSVPFMTGTTKVAESWHVLGPVCSRMIGGRGYINSPGFIDKIGPMYII